MMTSQKRMLRSFLVLSALECLLVFFVLASVASESENAVLFGYSLPRLAMMVSVFALFILFVWMSVSVESKMIRGVIVWLEGRAISKVSLFVIAICAFVLINSSESLFQIPLPLSRMSPLFTLSFLLGIQILILKHMTAGSRPDWTVFSEWNPVLAGLGWCAAGIFLVVIFVITTKIGLTPEIHGWHAPGTPLIFPQVFFAWLVGFLFIYKQDQWIGAWARFSAKVFSTPRLDWGIVFILWLSAVLIWTAEPMRRESYFNLAPTPPNFEYYPHSDAALYDKSAQNILIGAEQNNKIILRPLYAFFLAALHIVLGQNYSAILWGQIVFFAVIPAVGYLLTSRISGRPAGLLVAILLILREKNSIALTNVIEVSHSKLLMSDMPTTVLMLLLVYWLIKWLGQPRQIESFGLVSGAMFGLVMLVRSHQAQFIIPALAAGMIWIGGYQGRKTMLRITFFILGFFAVTAPWIWRNDRVNGKPALESAEFYISWYAGGYTEPGDTIEVLPGETEQEYSSRIKKQVIRYALNHPVELARVSTSYFMRNEIASLVYLPITLKAYTPSAYVANTRVWKEPLLDLGWVGGGLFFINLSLVCLGAIAAYKKLGWAGLLPLWIHITYNTSMSVARISGWRFVQPVDWVMLMYYGVGLIQATIILTGLFGIRLSREESDRIFAADSKKVLAPQYYFFAFLSLGMLLPLAEKIAAERYPPLMPEKLLARFAAGGMVFPDGDAIPLAVIEDFVSTEPNAVILYGRALYPSFYRIGEYWGDKQSITYLTKDIDRLHFTLIGSVEESIYFPLESPPSYFPHASDVFIVGCAVEGGVRALAVKPDTQPEFLPAFPWLGLTCRD